jgi:hypothetical protein
MPQPSFGFVFGEYYRPTIKKKSSEESDAAWRGRYIA